MIHVERLDATNKSDMYRIAPREQVGMPEAQVVDALADQPFSWIAYDTSGAPVGAVGAIAIGPDHYRCWAFIDRSATTRSLYFLLYWMNGLIEQSDFRRLEITVREDFTEGLHWLNRLGFEWEGFMRRFDIHGNNHHLLARVR